jgi:hypothetical protein
MQLMWHSDNGVSYFLVFSVVSGSLGLTVLGIVVWAWFSAKYEVAKRPREPMLLCDIHGAYPAKYSVKMTVPGMISEAELCPRCMEERVSKKRIYQRG